MRAGLAATLTVAVVLSCQADETARGVEEGQADRHPDPALLASESADVPVREVAFGALAGTLPPGLEALDAFPDESAVGELEGDPELTLGDILAGSPAQGGVVLLDGSHGTIRVFGEGGAPVGSAGGFGDGPGEVVDPVGLALAGDSVLVLDPGRRQLTRFGLEDGEPRPVDPVRLPLDAQDLCPTHGGYLALGLSLPTEGPGAGEVDPRTVHRLGPDGAIEQSFAEPYRYRGAMALRYLTMGRLACDPTSGEAWVAYTALGEIHAFDPDGELRWVIRLTDLTYPELVDEGGSRIRPDPESAERIEVVSRLVRVTEEVLAVQVESRGLPGGDLVPAGVEYRTYLLDAGTGEGLGAFRGPHRVIGAGDGAVVLYQDDPVPRFARLELASEGTGGGR